MPTIAKNYYNILSRLHRLLEPRAHASADCSGVGQSQPANLNIHIQALAVCSLVGCSGRKVKTV